MKRIISFILVLTTVLGCLALLPIGAWATGTASGGTISVLRPEKPAKLVEQYQNQNFASAQDKLDRDIDDKGNKNMVLVASYAGKELYASTLTGEVYVKDTRTGNILHSNPYNIKEIKSTTISPELMSQVFIRYAETERNQNKEITLNSFTDAAMHGQITAETIMNGIRINYALGDTTKRYLLPYGIMADEMIEILWAPMQEEIVAEIREIVSKAGVPEQYMNSHFDFVSFCESNKALYGTEKVLGKEYTYGNMKAFEAWFSNAMNFYNYFYLYEDYELYIQRDDPKIPRDPAWQAERMDKSTLSKVSSDYDRLEAVINLMTPYMSTDGNDPANWTVSQTSLNLYPILKETGKHPSEDPELNGKDYYCNSIFVLDTTLTPNKYREIEALFGEEVPGYTLAKAIAAEDETGVHPKNNDSPVFYVSIEYRLTEDGFTAEVPATSVMYDETLYKIVYINVLPYMGTADNREDGYFFFPDGSGSIIDFDEFRNSGISVNGKVYGQDYAKYVLEGLYQKNISMPVFGLVHDENVYVVETPYGTFPCSYTDYINKEFEISFRKDISTKTIYAQLPFDVEIPVTTYYALDANGYYNTDTTFTDDNVGTLKTKLRAKDFKLQSTSSEGYLAIVEEGAALTTISASFRDRMTNFSIRFTPRVEDKYTLKTDKAGDLVFTVQAKNKYMGSYALRYIMLADETDAAGVEGNYPPTYVGMAAAYQDYLVRNGLLPESADVKDQMPLIIESFGVMQTKKKLLSIPFTVDVALTTFDDVETMYEELNARGIHNIKFRLSGYVNGGMDSTYPVKLKWESETGGKGGFKDLLSYASDETRKANGLEIYPNFNFMYIRMTGGGVKLKDVGARCADNRYATRASYSSIYQDYVFNATDGLLVSSRYLEELFARFNKKYSKFNHYALSMNSIAEDLSGDFDEDNGITREESMNYITDMLDDVTASYSSVMSEGGNLYALKYMSYLVKAPLDCSRFKYSSRTIPFWGMVVHGHLNYTGEAFNEQANKDEALLRAIESGAGLYFVLSYANTQLMKDDFGLSRYYSVDYQNSRATVEEYYKKLNAAIGDLQSYRIVGHDLLYVERVGRQADIDAALAELEDEFLENLKQTTSQKQEDIRHMILAMRQININVADQLSRYDANHDGMLTDTEIDVAWLANENADIASKVTDQVRLYYTNPIISEIIGGANLDIDDNTARSQAESAASKSVYAAIINGTLKLEFGQSVGVAFNEEAVIASARRLLDVDTLSDAFVAEIRAFMAENTAEVNSVDFVAKIEDVNYTPKSSYFTTSHCLDENYRSTESTVSNGTVVMVTYSNGTDTVRIIINYNVFAVEARLDGNMGTVRLEKYGYMRLD